MLIDTLFYRLSSLLAGFSIMQPELGAQHDGIVPAQTPLVPSQPDFTADGGLLLSDLLTRENSLSIFYSYARETTAGRLLETEGAGVTVFAPTNKAVMALPRKP